MAYDEDLVERIRAELEGEPTLTERTMFGGLAFLLGGHMAVAASGQGGMMVRADPDDCDQWLAEGAEPMEMQGRTMRGWLRVSSDRLADQESVARWTERGAAYAKSLPAK